MNVLTLMAVMVVVVPPDDLAFHGSFVWSQLPCSGAFPVVMVRSPYYLLYFRDLVELPYCLA